MSREKELVKNTGILAVGTFFPKIVSIFSLPILTGMLTKTEYGTYDLIATLILLLLPIATLQIQSAAFRFLIESKGDQERCNQISVNIFAVTIPVTAIVLTVLYFVFGYLDFLTRIFICLYFLFNITEITLRQIARGFSENAAYSIASVILSALNLALILVFVLWRNLGLPAVMGSLALAAGVTALYLFFVVKKHVKFRSRYISWKIIKEMISYSWPMVFNNLSRWGLAVSDRVVITTVLGVDANAIYAVANKLPNLLSTFQSTFSMAWQENASLASNDKDSVKYYSEMFDSFYCFLCGLLAILIASTPILFKILIHGEYSEAYGQMPVLYLGMLFDGMATYLGGIYIAQKKTVSIGITTVIAAGVNIAIDILLVGRIGITAGSVSTLISYLFLLIYRMVDIRKVKNVHFKIPKMLVILMCIILMCVLCYQRNTQVDIINICLALALCIVINRKLLKSLTTHLLKKISRG